MIQRKEERRENKLYLRRKDLEKQIDALEAEVEEITAELGDSDDDDEEEEED